MILQKYKQKTNDTNSIINNLRQTFDCSTLNGTQSIFFMVN